MMAHMTSVAAARHPLDDHLPDPHFVERHRRTVDAPVEAVWAAALAVTPAEIRLLAPFMALRSLPRVLAGDRPRSLRQDRTPFLEAFEGEGFVELQREENLPEGRAVVVYGAAGRFWSVRDNAPAALADAEAFAQHRAPGTARTAFSLRVEEVGGSALLTTETRVSGTDADARRTFGRYWRIIRGPSGLIRRSWLAAIDRRARA